MLEISEYELEGYEIESHSLERKDYRHISYRSKDGKIDFGIATDMLGTQVCKSGSFFHDLSFGSIESAVQYVKDNLEACTEWASSIPSCQFDFAIIDAKDNAVVGFYWPEYGENLHNERIRQQAQFEYLQGIVKLQEQIREKFEMKTIPNKKIDGEPEYVTDAVYLENEETQKYTKEMDRLYYT